MVFAVILVVSGALVVGALWGLFGPLPRRVEGFFVALAGGALLLSVVTELVEPAMEQASLALALISTLIGAGVFTAVDTLIQKTWGEKSGGGLLAAITLDGVPENLALGVALIGAQPAAVAALAGSILLSNLPEAAGGAKDMRKNGMSPAKAVGLWVGTAVLLSAAALAGNLLLENASDEALASIRCLAAGAVIASLATEVFPKAYREDHPLAGIATALGFALALALGELGG
jgi:zinc transporter, ZIP family